MTTTIYIYQDADMIRTGRRPVAVLDEPPGTRAYIQRIVVELPEGYTGGELPSGEHGIYKGNEYCHLVVNASGTPCIIDSADGSYIPMRVIYEGWDEYIPLKQYAEMHGRSPATARQMAGRGGYQTARKLGRDWIIDPAEPYPDGRRRPH